MLKSRASKFWECWISLISSWNFCMGLSFDLNLSWGGGCDGSASNFLCTGTFSNWSKKDKAVCFTGSTLFTPFPIQETSFLMCYSISFCWSLSAWSRWFWISICLNRASASFLSFNSSSYLAFWMASFSFYFSFSRISSVSFYFCCWRSFAYKE